LAYILLKIGRRRKKMKKTIGLVVILVLLLPTLGISGALSFRLGYFVPRAQSDLWSIEFENMSFQKSDFQTTTLGIHYEHFLTKELSLVIGVDSYSQTRFGYYRDFVAGYIDDEYLAVPSQYYTGDAVEHNFSVSSTPIQMSLKLTPFGRRSGFIPYIGGGVSLYIWSVKLLGNMIDFSDEVPLIDSELGDIMGFGVYETRARAESRFSVGFQAFAGFMIPVASRLAIEAEFKYNVGKGSLGEAFEGFEDFDLGGFQISLGVNYWF
jgi:opacity protein-like surface antigen